MSEDRFDDGLVHAHGWATAPTQQPKDAFPIADASQAMTPSTVFHDEHVLPG